MKCSIDCDGMMEFQPETHAEAYALDCWLEENIYRLAGIQEHPAIVVSYKPEDLKD